MNHIPIVCNKCQKDSKIDAIDFLAAKQIAEKAGWKIILSCGWWMLCPDCVQAENELK